MGDDMAVLRNVGACETRFDDGYANSKLAHFMVQGFGVTFEGVLAGAVDSLVRRGNKPHYRSNVDDASRSLTSHEGEHGLGHSQNTEKIGFKKPFRFIDRRFFERANHRVACVVDQNIDPPGAIKNCTQARMDRLLFANVDVNPLDILQSSRGPGISPFGSEDSETMAGKQTGDGSTDSR